MTPQCPKQLASDEYNGEWIHLGVSAPGSDYVGESLLPCDEYASESTFLCTLNKHQNSFKKKLSGDKQFRNQDSPMYSSQGSLAYLMFFA